MVGINLDSTFCEIVQHICAPSFKVGSKDESENRSEILIFFYLVVIEYLFLNQKLETVTDYSFE
jgi:hypothetical protein